MVVAWSAFLHRTPEYPSGTLFILHAEYYCMHAAYYMVFRTINFGTKLTWADRGEPQVLASCSQAPGSHDQKPTWSSQSSSMCYAYCCTWSHDMKLAPSLTFIFFKVHTHMFGFGQLKSSKFFKTHTEIFLKFNMGDYPFVCLNLHIYRQIMSDTNSDCPWPEWSNSLVSEILQAHKQF